MEQHDAACPRTSHCSACAGKLQLGPVQPRRAAEAPRAKEPGERSFAYIRRVRSGVRRRLLCAYIGAVDVDAAPGRFRRNMPDPIPVIVLARLAVDRAWQGKGVARALMRDAGGRIAHAADLIGIRGVIAHALNEDAHRFYLALGFETSPLSPMTVMMTLADLKAAL